MEKGIIHIIILMLILACAIPILTFNLVNADVTDNKLEETYSYTKAICNETNFCQDYHVRCNGNDMVGISPITGAAVQFSHGWQDPRDEELKNGFCE